MKGHLNLVQTLLENGADVSCADQDGKSPATWAEETGHQEILQIYKGREKNHVDERTAKTSMEISGLPSSDLGSSPTPSSSFSFPLPYFSWFLA